MSSDNFINVLGYSLVSYPREDLSPLTLILAKKPSNFEIVGPFSKFLEKSPPEPEIIQNMVAANIEVAETSEMKTELGLDFFDGILKKILPAFSAEIKGGFSGADKIQILFENVLIDTIYPASIINYLPQCEPSKNSILFEFLAEESEDNEALLISEIIKSNSFSVISYDNKGKNFDAGVNIPEIIKINPDILKSDEKNKKITFKHDKHLIFGLKAFAIHLESWKERKPKYFHPFKAGERDGSERDIDYKILAPKKFVKFK